MHSRIRENGCPAIELRQICTSPSDYANPIELSVAGGAKIAEAIYRTLREMCVTH